MRIIDTHAHLFDEVFAEDFEEVVSRALQNDVEKVFLPNIDETTVTSMLGIVYKVSGILSSDAGASSHGGESGLWRGARTYGGTVASRPFFYRYR